MQFFSFQNVQSEVFKFFKMFRVNMKLTRAACWVNTKISKEDNNTTLMIFLRCHYVGHYYVIIEDP